VAKALVAAFVTALAGCATGGGPRPITPGDPCAVCGMRIEDLRYACEDQRAGTWRVYDSIECLLRSEPAGERAWLADYDTRALHAAESVWVLRAEIPSPMGGGYAAFLDRAAADEIAAARSGRVDRLTTFAAEASAQAGRP
jgi:nitrous oxide reductase accessory protein NosL